MFEVKLNLYFIISSVLLLLRNLVICQCGLGHLTNV